MPLYEVASGELVPFRRLRGGADLYESQLEDLLWENPDEFLGESLFRIAKQKGLPGGGRPDVIALDEAGRVVVIEIKRDVDRAQLAQCLEYAGWAKGASLDELSRMYHGGQDAFFEDWRSFTDSPALTVINRSPRLVLVAREFHGRTEQALQFLIDNELPVTLIRVSVYEDADGRRFVDVEGEFEPEVTLAADSPISLRRYTYGGRRVRLADLVDAALLMPGDSLIWDRPRVGQLHKASITENGSIALSDGRVFSSPSRAAYEVTERGSFDGWYAWRVERLDNCLLKDVREQFTAAQAQQDVAANEAEE